MRMKKGKVIIPKGSDWRNKANDYFDTSVKHGEVKNVTEDYKKSLLTEKAVEVKSRFPNQDTKLWEKQPKKIFIGKINGTRLWQYVSATTK